MEYTLSVFLPEVAIQNQEAPGREELCKKAGVQPPQSNESSAPLLVHLMRQLKQGGGGPSAVAEIQKPAPTTVLAQQPVKEEVKQAPVKKQEERKNNYFDDYIEEDIIEDIEDKQQNFFKDDQEGIGASGSLGIDQSIDTLRLDEYDYVEEIKYY